jgi:hypothetical protein
MLHWPKLTPCRNQELGQVKELGQVREEEKLDKAMAVLIWKELGQVRELGRVWEEENLDKARAVLIWKPDRMKSFVERQNSKNSHFYIQ